MYINYINDRKSLGYCCFKDEKCGKSLENEIQAVDYSRVRRIASLAALVLLFATSPASAADAVVTPLINQTERNARATALLLAADALSCNKVRECIAKKVQEKSSQNPKAFAIVVCTFAAAWCVRGVAERIIHKHL